MIDNFNIFAPWFDNLSDQGDFYFVQVIQRKKDCNVGSNNNVIKDYHFFDKKSFLNKKEEIRCDFGPYYLKTQKNRESKILYFLTYI